MRGCSRSLPPNAWQELTLSCLSPFEPFRLGRVPVTLTSQSMCAPGYLEDVRFYKQALTEEQVGTPCGATTGHGL
jgi:hypothetical protein